MSCSAIREGDEYSCHACGLRWPADDPDGSNCRGAVHSLRGAPVRVDKLALTTRLAQALMGPYDDRWVGREKLLELRRHKWSSMATDLERRKAYGLAQHVLEELRLLPREELLALLDSK